VWAARALRARLHREADLGRFFIKTPSTDFVVESTHREVVWKLENDMEERRTGEVKIQESAVI
jgi:hypothetical protein